MIILIKKKSNNFLSKNISIPSDKNILQGAKYFNTSTMYTTAADEAAILADERDKQIIFKNWAPFTDCISKIENVQLDNSKDLDVLMPVYNLNSDKNSKPSRGLCQYYRD